MNHNERGKREWKEERRHQVREVKIRKLEESNEEVQVTVCQERGEQRKKKYPSQLCPFPGCSFRSRKIKSHTFKAHIPTCCQEDVVLSQETCEKILRVLKFLMDSLRINEDEMVKRINGKGIPDRSVISEKYSVLMTELCLYAGWSVPECFTLHPVNSWAVLLHWRCLAILCNELSTNQRHAFGKYAPEINLIEGFIVIDEVVSEEVVDDNNNNQQTSPVFSSSLALASPSSSLCISSQSTIVSSSSSKCVPVTSLSTNTSSILCPSPQPTSSISSLPSPQPTSSISSLPSSLAPMSIPTCTSLTSYISSPCISSFDTSMSSTSISSSKLIYDYGFDSHFHLDRTGKRVWGAYNGESVQRLLDTVIVGQPLPPYPVKLDGGVMVFSEPKHHPRIPFPSSVWKTAIGCHPKHMEELTDATFHHISEMMLSPEVAALGEIGLDRGVPVREWRKQEAVFGKMLQLASLQKPIVLHLRGSSADYYNIDVSSRAREILSTYVDPRQPIHLHCFSGDVLSVSEWLAKFPNVYFGFTGKVKTFNLEQIQALRKVPPTRLLIETDSPYLPTSGSINTPIYLGGVARLVAGMLEESLQSLLRKTWANGRNLYGH